MGFTFKLRSHQKSFSRVNKINYMCYRTWRYLYLVNVRPYYNRASKRYWGRATTIPASFLRARVRIYTGKKWKIRYVNRWMVGYRVGEFTWNRRLAMYKAKQLRKKALKALKALQRSLKQAAARQRRKRK